MTVGYGDIVPRTDQARMFDAFVVTSILGFISMVFWGTAHTFVGQRQWAQFRMMMTRKNLVMHTIICGYGTSGESAAKELFLRNLTSSHRCAELRERVARLAAVGTSISNIKTGLIVRDLRNATPVSASRESRPIVVAGDVPIEFYTADT